jgi:hypothetical protein
MIGSFADKFVIVTESDVLYLAVVELLYWVLDLIFVYLLEACLGCQSCHHSSYSICMAFSAVSSVALLQ